MSDETAIEEVTDAELHQAFIAARETEMMTAFPAKVESYDAGAQTVQVVPALAKHLSDGQGNYIPELPPKLSDVPVCFPRCGSFFLSFPIQAGDYVLVVCCQKNIGNWRATGNAGDPGDLGMHTLDGAVAIPGVFPDSAKLSNADGTNMVLGSDTDGNGRIELATSSVRLGAGASKGVARTGDPVEIDSPGLLATWMSQVEGFINGLVAATVVPLSSTFLSLPGVEIKSGSSHITAVD